MCVDSTPETPSLGWSISHQAIVGGARPDGSKAYEICYIAKGGAEWWIGNKLYEAGPGSTSVNKPGDWHGGESALLQPCERCWVRFIFPPDGDLPGLRVETIRNLKRAFETMPQRHFPASPQMKDLGFSSSQYFATVFKKLVGLTPSEYRKLRNL
jgi:hypothetical protein